MFFMNSCNNRPPRVDSLEKGSRVPDVFLFLLGLLATHAALVCLGSWQVIHVGHLAYLGNWCGAYEALLLSTHPLVVLLILSILVLALGFFFTIEHGQFLLERVVLHAEFTADRHQTTQAINVVLVFLVDFFIDFKSLVE